MNALYGYLQWVRTRLGMDTPTDKQNGSTQNYETYEQNFLHFICAPFLIVAPPESEVGPEGPDTPTGSISMDDTSAAAA
jgi:hypothetical protein